MKIHTKVDYAAARREIYPDVGDQLDAVLALAMHMRESGSPLPEKTLRWIDTCLAVKERIRKI